ncbi:MAG: FixH family protein [Pseudomonadota bacterium]
MTTGMMMARASDGGRPWTGRHVLFALLAFFAVIIAVNAVFLTVAIRSFPGEQEKKSYLQGLNYNDVLERRAAQEALGWSVRIDEAAVDGARGAVTLVFSSADGAPLSGLSVTGSLGRLVDDETDRVLTFSLVGPGTYRGVIDDAAPGAWSLQATATGAGGERFDIVTKVRLQ